VPPAQILVRTGRKAALRRCSITDLRSDGSGRTPHKLRTMAVGWASCEIVALIVRASTTGGFRRWLHMVCTLTALIPMTLRLPCSDPPWLVFGKVIRLSRVRTLTLICTEGPAPPEAPTFITRVSGLVQCYRKGPRSGLRLPHFDHTD